MRYKCKEEKDRNKKGCVIMVSVSMLNKRELTEFVNEADALSRKEKTAFCVERNEIFSHLKVREKDSFLMIKYRGWDIEQIFKELKYIHLPARTYGSVVIVRGSTETTIRDIVKGQEAMTRMAGFRDYSPLLGWIVDDKAYETEVQFITKVYDEADLKDRCVMDSLLEVIFDGLDTKNDRAFCESLGNVGWSRTKDTLEFQMSGMTRSGFIMSCKKMEIEKRIFEYTGQRLCPPARKSCSISCPCGLPRAEKVLLCVSDRHCAKTEKKSFRTT